MKIEIRAMPDFWIEMTREHITVLMACASLHYDGVCKSSTLVGGFLFGWKNSIDWAVESGQTFASVNGPFRILDISMKILENSSFLSKTDQAIACDLRRCFRSAMIKANDKMSQIIFYMDET